MSVEDEQGDSLLRDRVKSVIVPRETAGRLDKAVKDLFDVSWGIARGWIETGKITVADKRVTELSAVVKENMILRYCADLPHPKKDGEISKRNIVYIDSHVLVAEKPAGVLTVPFEEGDRGTFDQQLRSYLARTLPKTKQRRGPLPSLMVVHRLDRGTSGLLVFARTFLAKEALSVQFRAHTVERKYLALVHGLPISKTIQSHLLEDRGDGIRGSSESSPHPSVRKEARGKIAITHIEVVERLNGATMISCRLETGRTNQIRIHLSEDGHPLIGETIYMRKFKNQPIESPRLMLHAAELGFVHPVTEKSMHFESPLPSEFAALIEKLR